MPKYARKLAKAAHSLSAEALGLDEFETLQKEKSYLGYSQSIWQSSHSKLLKFCIFLASRIATIA
jgi:hypothetical protein